MDAIDTNRWTIVTNHLSTWWPPLTEQDSISAQEIALVEQKLGLKLPSPLQEWYILFGRRQDFVGNQDHLLPVEELRIIDEVLVFCIENQGVTSWGIHFSKLELADPPIVVDGSGGGPTPTWLDAGTSLFVFLTSMVLFASVLSGKFTGQGSPTPQLIELLKYHYDDLYLPNTYLGTFLGDADTLIMLNGNIDEAHIWMASRTHEAIERFLNLVGREWGEITHGSEYWMHTYGSECRDVAPPYIVNYPMKDPLEVPGIFPPCHLTSRGATMSAYPNPGTLEE